MPRFDACIFDLDGLLLDTERLAIAAAHETLTSLGLHRIEGLFESLVGRDEVTGARVIAQAYGNDFPSDDFGRAWSARFAARLDRGIPLRPGAADLLGCLAEKAVPCAIATSSQRQSAHRKLAQAGLAHHFRAVVTYDCVKRPKPAPEPYLLAAERLGFAPARCIAFEDSDPGAEAAARAGMVVVQVPDMLATDGPHADHLAPDLLTGARMAGLI